MLIGILETGRAPDALRAKYGDYPDAFARLLDGHGFAFRTYAALDGELPVDPHECDGWLITGSRHAAYEDHPWIPKLEEFIRSAYVARVPLVGICFGHQIVAQAMGGKVEKYSGGWAVGRTEYDWGGRKIALNAWHQDQVTEKPDVARRIASNASCENAALLYDDRMLTIQAHPEFTSAFTRDLMEIRGRGVVPETLLDEAARGFDKTVDNAQVADEIAHFFLTHEVG